MEYLQQLLWRQHQVTQQAGAALPHILPHLHSRRGLGAPRPKAAQGTCPSPIGSPHAPGALAPYRREAPSPHVTEPDAFAPCLLVGYNSRAGREELASYAGVTLEHCTPKGQGTQAQGGNIQVPERRGESQHPVRSTGLPCGRSPLTRVLLVLGTGYASCWMLAPPSPTKHKVSLGRGPAVRIEPGGASVLSA